MDLDCRTWDWLDQTALWLHAQRDIRVIQEGVLDRISEAIPHRASIFDLCRTDEAGMPEFFAPVSTTMDEQDLDAYYRTYAAQDYTTWSFNPARPTIYRDLELVSPTIRDTTPIYREWMEPQGLYYGMGCTIVAQGALYGSITLFSGRELGDFTDTQMRALSLLERHLAVRLSDLWPDGFCATSAHSPLEELIDAHRITGREREVLRLLAQGVSNRSISETLYISESTVKKHVNALYKKLHVENRMQLAAVLWPSGSQSRGTRV